LLFSIFVVKICSIRVFRISLFDNFWLVAVTHNFFLAFFDFNWPVVGVCLLFWSQTKMLVVKVWKKREKRNLLWMFEVCFWVEACQLTSPFYGL
jgi:hypothetical protein